MYFLGPSSASASALASGTARQMHCSPAPVPCAQCSRADTGAASAPERTSARALSAAERQANVQKWHARQQGFGDAAAASNRPLHCSEWHHGSSQLADDNLRQAILATCRVYRCSCMYLYSITCKPSLTAGEPKQVFMSGLDGIQDKQGAKSPSIHTTHPKL